MDSGLCPSRGAAAARARGVPEAGYAALFEKLRLQEMADALETLQRSEGRAQCRVVKRDKGMTWKPRAMGFGVDGTQMNNNRLKIEQT